ncbi:MAG: MFS transporter [Cyanobacteria bacterium P01_H01_bin.15]
MTVTSSSSDSSAVDPTSLPKYEDESGSLMDVLRNRRFLLLWSGQIFSQLADKVFLVMAIAIIASQFQGPDQKISGWVSAVTIAFTLPAVFLGSLAGVYVDRWSKKWVLVVSNLLRGALVLLLPAILSAATRHWWGLPSGFWGLLLITLLVSTLTQFFAPAEQAAIPLIVLRSRLLSANSLFTTTMMALLIIGFALGEPLINWADELAGQLGCSGVGKEVLVGGGYGVAGLILLGLNIPEKRKVGPEVNQHPWHDIQAGIAYLGQNRRVRNALIQLTILFCIFAALVVLAVSLADTLPGMEAEEFGSLLATGGLGLGIGAIPLGQWGNRLPRARLSVIGSLGMALALVGLAFGTQNAWMALAFTGFLGLSASLVGIPMQTSIQAETPENMRGKIFGLQNNAVNIALSLPLAAAGIAETFLGLKIVFLLLATLALFSSFLAWRIVVNSNQTSG